jgi:hypothetical protein
MYILGARALGVQGAEDFMLNNMKASFLPFYEKLIIDIRRQGRTPGGVPTAYAEADP